MSKMSAFALLAALVAQIIVAEDPHEEHGHGDAQTFEWAGIFQTPDELYTWTAQKVKGAYADATMKLVALPVEHATEVMLHGSEGEGLHSYGLNCSDVEAGGVISPIEDACYNLHFDQNMWQSVFRINASTSAAIAFFTEHAPTEFEATDHYLKDSVGDDIESVAELPEEAVQEATSNSTDEEIPWVSAIVAGALVNLVTLSGVIFCVPMISKVAAANAIQLQGLVSGFAAGALLASTFFLLLFEATHLIATGWTEEVEVLWRWGTMTIAGFLLPAIVAGAACLVTGATANADGASMEGKQQAAEEAGQPKRTELSTQENSGKVRILSGVLVGDFFHNLCDGFFLGAAFKGCGGSFGWGVALATILHEFPQELADYAILTGPGVGLRPAMALLSNFLSGLSVTLGAVIILSTDVDDAGVGLLLAFAGGVYLHIGATECMPRIYDPRLSGRIRVACIMLFIMGATLIGLVLVGHEHCVPDTSSSTSGGAPASGHHAHGH